MASSTGQFVVAIMGLLAFSSSLAAHYFMYKLPPKITDSTKLLSTIQNAWFTAACFGSVCAIWSGLTENNKSPSMLTSPLGIASTIANRLEFSYPLTAAFTLELYKFDHRHSVMVGCVIAVLLRRFMCCLGYGNIFVFGLYLIIATLHSFVFIQAGNYAGAMGAISIIFACNCNLFRAPKLILYLQDTYESLLGTAAAVICFGLSYTSLDNTFDN